VKLIQKYKDLKQLTKIKAYKNLDWKVVGLYVLMVPLNSLIMLAKTKEPQARTLF